jgi:hypothetical protein
MPKMLPTVLAAALLCGCNSLNFEVADAPVGKVVTERKSFFFWGLTPERRVDVSTYCPDGAKAVQEETTFGDGFLSLITLGIYSPRSSTYLCR